MKDIALLLGGVAAAAAVCYALEKDNKREDFGTIPAQSVYRIPEVKVQNKYGANMFSVPPNWQGNLPPRFSNTGYGAYILYNVPEEENLAVPKYPLTTSGNVREGYSSQVCQSGCASDLIQSHNSAQMDMQDSSFIQDAAQGKIPLGEMTLPGDTQIYNYDRLVFAQKRSRLHGLGDPIRGDLPVVPIQDQWFRPSTRPNIDLRQGAITTISGHDNTTSKQLRALQSDYSGKTALAQKDISFDGRSADIFVTAFP